MPNQINSQNWSIDDFESSNLGPTNAGDFRTFLFSNNLPGIPPEIQQYFPLASLDDRGTQYNVNKKSFTDPGNVESWFEEGGYEVSTHEIRDIGMLMKNKYGPGAIYAYNCPEMIPEDTGFLQYQTGSGSDFRASLVGQQLGFGYAAGLDFDSELNDIAKEQRKLEFQERVKQNFIQDTVGKINADPLGLLTGQPLFQQDFQITKLTSLGGQALEALSDLSGVNIPVSTIPEGAFGQYGSSDYSEDLLDATGGGTRSLIYDSLAINIYGPTLIDPNKSANAGPNSGISNAIKKAENFTKKLASGNPPQTKTYLDPVDPVTDFTADQSDQQGRELGAGIVNKAVSNFIDGIANKNGVTKTLVPTENRPDANGNISPTLAPDHTKQSNNLGFDSVDTTYESEKSDEDYGHTLDYTTDLGPKRHVTLDEYSSLTDMTADADKWFWTDAGDTKNGATRPSRKTRRGLLNYTQQMVNQQINSKDGAARYIGAANSEKNYGPAGFDEHGRTRKHNTFSMGNKTKTADGKYYCRSWSTRRAYNEYVDLIRHDGLWRENQPGGENLSSFISLRSPGLPKIAWEHDGVSEQAIVKALKDNTGYIPREYVIPYMLSIENLAWQGSPHYFKLPACERGPNGGRLMWFPPYNINFTDNTSINWDTTVFIGRAEPIYTYNHTERTGTLTFSVIVDHPSVLNKLREDFQVNLESFFAGCDTERARQILEEAFQGYTTPNGEENQQEPDPIPSTNLDIPNIGDTLRFYFKNAKNYGTRDNDTGNGGASNSTCGNTSIVGNPDLPSTFVGRNTVGNTCIGRCIDINYEIGDKVAIDNVNLYRTDGSGDEPIPNSTTLTDAQVFPFTDNVATEPTSSPYSTPTQPPCTTSSGFNWPWGPGANKDGNGSDSNFCKQTSEQFFTTVDGTTYSTSTHGIKYERPGFNDRDFFKYEFTDAPDISKYGVGIDALCEFLVKEPKGKGYMIKIEGGTSDAASNEYNTLLAQDRSEAIRAYMYKKMSEFEGKEPIQWTEGVVEPIDLYLEERKKNDRANRGESGGSEVKRWWLTTGQITSPKDTDENFVDLQYTDTPFHLHPEDRENSEVISRRTTRISLIPKPELIQATIDEENRANIEELRAEEERKKKAEEEALRQNIIDTAKNFINECDYFAQIKEEQPFVYGSIREKIQNFHPAFHSMTPEGFNSRLTFLQQCGRQGPSFIDPLQPQNTAFGKPPICILRIGDFYHTKIVIDTINFTFDPIQWDLNPEGIGVQPMVCTVDLNFKFIGGSSLQGPIRQLQNAVSYNFFANTSLYMGLEEIIARRGSQGFEVGGFTNDENPVVNSDYQNAIDESYWYGPFGSQTQADNAATRSQEAIRIKDEQVQEEIANKKAAEDARQAELDQELKDKIEEVTNDEGAVSEAAQENTNQVANSKVKNLPIKLTMEVGANNNVVIKGIPKNGSIQLGEMSPNKKSSWEITIKNTGPAPIIPSMDVSSGVRSPWVVSNLTLSNSNDGYRYVGIPITPGNEQVLRFSTSNNKQWTGQEAGNFSKSFTLTMGGSSTALQKFTVSGELKQGSTGGV